MNFGVFSKQPIWFISFFTVVTQTISALICLFVVEIYGTRYNRPDKRFLKVPQFYPSVHKSKKHFGHSFAFDAPTLWNDFPEDVLSATTPACFRKKLKSYLFDKALPPLYLNFPASLWCQPGYVSRMMTIELDLVSRLRVCHGKD